MITSAPGEIVGLTCLTPGWIATRGSALLGRARRVIKVGRVSEARVRMERLRVLIRKVARALRINWLAVLPTVARSVFPSMLRDVTAPAAAYTFAEFADVGRHMLCGSTIKRSRRRRESRLPTDLRCCGFFIYSRACPAMATFDGSSSSFARNIMLVWTCMNLIINVISRRT